MDKFKIKNKKLINNLPKTAGVYCFLEKNNIIYIGKAINIKDRVKSHFNQPTYKDEVFVDKVQKIGYIETNSEIEALILEANLIKKYRPKFNVVWKDDKNYFYVAITKDEKAVIYITHQKDNQKTEYIGPFIDGNSLKKSLKFLRRVFPFYTASRHPKNKCPWCHLGLCPGPNSDIKEYKKNLKKLVLILKGERKTALNQLKKEMKELVKEKKFEEAARIRDKIYALEKVIAHRGIIAYSVSQTDFDRTKSVLRGILNLEKDILRMECYDISNIQGKQATGSMVVFKEGQPDKGSYKKFKIRMENEPNDIAMLREILKRRLSHEEWTYPEVILIDGGIAQLNVAIKTKAEDKKSESIKIISIAKRDKELYIEGRKDPIPLKTLPQGVYNLIIHMDDEAHRFAITYHKKLRKQNLLR